MLLVTGPTGSGKTTTLYAALQSRNTAAEKIITVEDPIEYQLAGITQVPVHRQAGVTFGARAACDSAAGSGCRDGRRDA